MGTLNLTNLLISITTIPCWVVALLASGIAVETHSDTLLGLSGLVAILLLVINFISTVFAAILLLIREHRNPKSLVSFVSSSAQFAGMLFLIVLGNVVKHH